MGQGYAPSAGRGCDWGWDAAGWGRTQPGSGARAPLRRRTGHGTLLVSLQQEVRIPDPRLSVILVATAEYPVIRDAVRNLRRQSDVPIELVIAGPQALQDSMAESDRADLESFPAWRHVVISRDTQFDAARAAAVRAASAPYVAFTEDHSFPRPGWAAALVAALDEGFTVVGPVVENGNPTSQTSWGNFILEYGVWMPPGRRGEWAHLPGHNSAYRRDVLVALGDRLASLLEVESVLHWELARSGHRLAQEPRARTRHVNFSRFAPSVKLRFHGGRQFAANRAKDWTLPTRLAYAAAFPVIAGVRLARSAAMVPSSARPATVLGALPLIGILVLVSSLGESVGYLTRRVGSSADFLSDIEHDRRRFLAHDEEIREEARAAAG